jgi:hypothetical protein
MDAKKVHEVLDIYALRIDDMARATENDLSAKRCDPTKKYAHSEYAHRIRHIRWCADQCRIMVDDGRMEKAFRWLGFMQGALWDMGLYAIEELANHNKPAGEETNLDRNPKDWLGAHADHGRGTSESGPDDPDCPCRNTPEMTTCAFAGCGFCTAALPK